MTLLLKQVLETEPIYVKTKKAGNYFSALVKTEGGSDLLKLIITQKELTDLIKIN